MADGNHGHPDDPRDGRALRTVAVHAGEPRPGAEDAIAMPLFTSSTYVLGDPAEFDDIRYVRLNNTPNQRSVSEKLAALERTDAAVVTPSGTSAISMALLSHLESGDHLIAQERVYGGTHKLFDRLCARYGIEVTYAPLEDMAAWERAVRPTTKLLFLESITNPLLDIPPLTDAVALARDHGFVTLVDNTFASPMNFRPAEMGFDLVLHSASKYLNGHTDVVAGVIAGEAKRIERVRRMLNLTGVCLDPHACYLLQRGLKTLPLRVPAQNRNALALARMLSEHRRVRAIRYPGLPGDPSYARASRWFDGYGAMLTFVPEGGVRAAEALMESLELASIAPSLGGVETLISRPATTSHAGFSPEVRRGLGVTDDMIRVSVGIEGERDLIEDFHRALDAMSKVRSEESALA